MYVLFIYNLNLIFKCSELFQVNTFTLKKLEYFFKCNIFNSQTHSGGLEGEFSSVWRREVISSSLELIDINLFKFIKKNLQINKFVGIIVKIKTITK